MNFRKKRKVVETQNIDITSLLDILVILLVFLLKNYNESQITIDLIDELALPYSQSKELVQNSVTLQMNSSKSVYVQYKEIGNLDDDITKTHLLEEIDQLSPNKEKRKLINLVVDKSLVYKDINKLLRYIDELGFSQYKLIIEGPEM